MLLEIMQIITCIFVIIICIFSLVQQYKKEKEFEEIFKHMIKKYSQENQNENG